MACCGHCNPRNVCRLSLPRSIGLARKASPTPRLSMRHSHSAALEEVPTGSINAATRSATQSVTPLTLLHKTKELLPRVLPSSDTSTGGDPTLELQFWTARLSEGYTSLTVGSETLDRQARIVVYANSAHSQPQARDLVTALLEQPFGDETQNEAIRRRWDRHDDQNTLTIEQGTAGIGAAEDSHFLHLKSSYLTQFSSSPLQIVELPPSSDAEATARIYSSDIPIIVCSPFGLGAIPKMPEYNPHTLLAIVPLQAPVSKVEGRGDSHLERIGTIPQVTTIFVDPTRALEGLRALRESSTSGHGSVDVQRYQDNFSGSNISSITSIISKPLSFSSNEFQQSRALTQIRGALQACLQSLQSRRDETADVCSKVNELDLEMEVLRRTAPEDILGKDLELTLKTASDQIRSVVDTFGFLRMATQVDQISIVMTETMEQAWCRQLETKLIMHAGTLAANQTSMTAKAFGLPLQSSPLLHNTLQQLRAEPNYVISPSALTGPIHMRRSQVAMHTSPQLHLAGQHAVMGMTGSVLTGTGVTWAGWVGWLMQSTDDFTTGVIAENLSAIFATVDPTTLMGVGTLISLGGIRWAIGSWQKAKKRWWEDLHRVGQGLGRDLRALLDATVDQKVLLVARTAVDGLREKIEKRNAEAHDIQVEVDRLQQELVNAEDKIPAK